LINTQGIEERTSDAALMESIHLRRVNWRKQTCLIRNAKAGTRPAWLLCLSDQRAVCSSTRMFSGYPLRWNWRSVEKHPAQGSQAKVFLDGRDRIGDEFFRRGQFNAPSSRRGQDDGAEVCNCSRCTRLAVL